MSGIQQDSTSVVSMKAQGSDRVYIFMTLLRRHLARKGNDPVSGLVPLCGRVGDVEDNARFE